MITLFVGYDEREAAVYHVFCQSILDTCSQPVQFIPLHGPLLENFNGQKDGTNRFIYSRYLVPWLMDHKGWAIFADGDMLCQRDISELWDQREDQYALKVVPHEYETTESRKFIGTPLENDNINYPRKNQSSLMLINCGHPSNRILTREFVADAGPQMLHRFQWLRDEEIGDLPESWNWLVGELPENQGANLLHYTLGAPAFEHYRSCDSARNWHNTFMRTINMEGEDPVEMVRRSRDRQWRVLRSWHKEA